MVSFRGRQGYLEGSIDGHGGNGSSHVEESGHLAAGTVVGDGGVVGDGLLNRRGDGADNRGAAVGAGRGGRGGDARGAHIGVARGARGGGLGKDGGQHGEGEQEDSNELHGGWWVVCVV